MGSSKSRRWRLTMRIINLDNEDEKEIMMDIRKKLAAIPTSVRSKGNCNLDLTPGQWVFLLALFNNLCYNMLTDEGNNNRK